MDTLGAVLGPLCATALLGVLGARGVFMWAALPGLIAAAAFAFLAPAAKRVAGHHAPSIASSFKQLPNSYWHFLAGVFAHGIGDFAPTLLILRASQILGPRFGTGKAATVAVALYTFYNFTNAVASYPAGAIGDRIGKRGLLAVGYFVGAYRLRWFYLRAAHDYRPGPALWTGRNSWRVSAVARKITRGGNFTEGNSRLGLRSSCHREWHWRSDFEYCGGCALVECKSCGGIRLCRNFHACRGSCNLSLALIQPAAALCDSDYFARPRGALWQPGQK